MELVEKLLSYGPICDHCLGRCFGKKSHGLSNDSRGHALRVSHALHMNIPYTDVTARCWICGDLFQHINRWAERAVAVLGDLEYTTFLVGTRVPPLIAESEELMWGDCELTDPEPLKAEMNREVGKRIALLTMKDVDFTHPDVVVILALAKDRVELQINPLFIIGRYCKYERGIPQTRWFCRECHGSGCPRCDFTGKMYQDSVEELIGRHVVTCFKAADAILHGSGREDIDARMMGSGRPFIMEVVSPRKRSVNLPALECLINEKEVNRVSVTFEGYSDRATVQTIKSKQSYKRYRILVEVDGRLSLESLHDVLVQLRGVTVHQRTPRRVAHRRANLVRERRVIDIEVMGIEDGRFLIDVIGEAGLYIKELVSGDEGRTDPSLSSMLGMAARVVRIDVVHVENPGGTDSTCTT